MRRSILTLVLACAGILVACDSPTDPQSFPFEDAVYGEQTKDYCERDPNCPAYADEFPDSDGYFVGTDINWNDCVDDQPGLPGSGDLDLDGVSDYWRRFWRTCSGQN